MKRLVPPLILAITLFTAPGSAQDGISLSGRTFQVRVKQGSARVTYAAGTMTGTATNSIGLSSTDSGVWHRTGANTICQRWNRWLDGQTQCLTLRPMGNMVKWTDQNGVTGLAK
jgi:hypothetical protein